MFTEAYTQSDVFFKHTKESSSQKSITLDDRCLILIPCNKIITRNWAKRECETDEEKETEMQRRVEKVSIMCWKAGLFLVCRSQMCARKCARWCCCWMCCCGFVTRSLIGFKFELNWPEDIFWFLSIVLTATRLPSLLLSHSRAFFHLSSSLLLASA